MPHPCAVCGYPDLELPQRGSEGGGSFEICPCCGFQSGVDDDDRGIPPSTWRRRWIEAGMTWWSRGQRPPAGWDPRLQLDRIEALRAGGPTRVPKATGSSKKRRRGDA